MACLARQVARPLDFRLQGMLAPTSCGPLRIDREDDYPQPRVTCAAVADSHSIPRCRKIETVRHMSNSKIEVFETR